MPTPSPFTILDRFLARGLHEVEGRGDEPVPPEIQEQIKLLADGKLEGAQRETLARQLNERPEWLAALAREVKARRASRRKGPSE